MIRFLVVSKIILKTNNLQKSNRPTNNVRNSGKRWKNWYGLGIDTVNGFDHGLCPPKRSSAITWIVQVPWFDQECDVVIIVPGG